jgi:K+-sensing histidine kinase KdpD
LENVLNNAVKHSEPGTIEIVTRWERKHVVIAVTNSGKVDRINEVFHVYKTSKEYSGGTGLGMSIVKRFIEVQGGSVSMANLSEDGVDKVKTTISLTA